MKISYMKKVEEDLDFSGIKKVIEDIYIDGEETYIQFEDGYVSFMFDSVDPDHSSVYIDIHNIIYGRIERTSLQVITILEKYFIK